MINFVRFVYDVKLFSYFNVILIPKTERLIQKNIHK